MNIMHIARLLTAGLKRSLFASMMILALIVPASTANAATHVNTVSVGAQVGSLTAGVAGSVTYTVTITGNGNGGLVVTPNVTGLPSGATKSFSPTTVTINNGTSATTTLTINTTIATPSGVTGFTVTNNDNGVTGAGTLTIGAPADVTPPTVAVNQAGGQNDPTNVSPINFTAVFNESVTGLTSGEVTLGGTAGATTAVVTGSGTTYNIAVSGMTGSGTVTASLGAGVAQDGGNNGNLVSTATDNTVTYDVSNPVPTLDTNPSGITETTDSPVSMGLTFSEGVTGLDLSDIDVDNGTAQNLTGSGDTYAFEVVPTAPGTVTVSLPEDVATETSGPGNTNSSSNVVSFEFVVPTECSDGEDNDEDGRVDEEDPGCTSAEDDDEEDPVVPALCADGLDNDEDGFTDLEDLGCTGIDDDDETDEPSGDDNIPTCPDGYALVEGQCISDSDPVPPTCPDGFELDGDMCVDVSPEPPSVCPEGYSLSGEMCVEDNPENPENPGEETPSCPEGTTAGEGGCYEDPVPPTECPDNFTLTEGMCVADPIEPSCPEGMELNGGGDLCVDEETPEDTGGGGGRNINMGTSDDSSEGEVLGAETGPACGPLLSTYLRAGSTATDQVKLLQLFLSMNLGITLDADGIYDAEVTKAVSDFQIKYWEDVLAPWVPFGLPTDHTSTGTVYKTTQWKINDLFCPSLNLPAPTLP